MRTESGDVETGGWLETRSTNWVNLFLMDEPTHYRPHLSSTFVAEEDDTNVAIVFSAEARTNGARLLVRAKIDGAYADPGDVVFAESNFQGARSFLFTTQVDAGVHNVQIEWKVDTSTGLAGVRGAALHVRKATEIAPTGTLAVRSAPDTGSSITAPGWQPVDDMTLSFFVPQQSDVFVRFSATTSVIGDEKSVWARARIDGNSIRPKDVVLARSQDRQAHMMVFGKKNVAPGWHTARIEWNVTVGGAGLIGERSMSVSAFPDGTGLTQSFTSPPSGPSVSTNSNVFEPVPGLLTWAHIPPNGEVSVSVSGEMFAGPGNDLILRARVGAAISNEEVIASAGGAAGYPTETQSFTFDLKHLNVGNQPQPIGIEWMVTNAAGDVAMGDRTLAVVVEPGMQPDLAEGQRFGSDNTLIDPVIGTRRLLTILHDPHREELPTVPNVRPTKAAIENALFGPGPSMRDYFEVVSGGRMTVQNEGVLGWFDACQEWEHYWGLNGTYDCNANNGGMMDNGFVSGDQERYYEALMKADPFVNFADYDTNNDGILDWQTELSILIVVPQFQEKGKIWNAQPFCGGEALITCEPGGQDGFAVKIDGVEIRVFATWSTALTGNIFPATVPTHELGHQILGLGDMYRDGTNTLTEAKNLSIMGTNLGASPLIDAMHRLALGWAEPRMIDDTGSYQLEDARTSDLVYVLPRIEGGDGREFYVLENRQNGANDPLYDNVIGSTGILVWHVIESTALNVPPPACEDPVIWGVFGGGTAVRQGIRLVRPHFLAPGPFSGWNDMNYDVSGVGLVCPSEGDDWTQRRNVLLWADWTDSGYSLGNWSLPSPVMSFDVLAVP